MEKLIKIGNRLMLLLVALCASMWVAAQESGAKVDVNVTKTTESTTWYTNPIVWIIGIAIFLLLFAAIIRGNSSRG